MSDRDYYEILGLTPLADGAMVDQAYWHLARKYQQLAVTNPRAQHLLDELNESYGVLGNPRLREQYDAFRQDVLVRQGMLNHGNQRKRRKEPDAPAGQKSGQTLKDKARDLSGKPIPAISQEQRRAYLVAGVIAALGIAGAWQGVNIMFVAAALVTGLAFSLIPTVRRHLPDMSLQFPSMPSIQAPRLGMPNLGEMPAFRDQFGLGKDEGIDADTLRASTATTIARWRQSVGLRDAIPAAAGGPDTTLVEIFEDERELGDADEPLAAVIDILRGSRTPTADR